MCGCVCGVCVWCVNVKEPLCCQPQLAHKSFVTKQWHFVHRDVRRLVSLLGWRAVSCVWYRAWILYWEHQIPGSPPSLQSTEGFWRFLVYQRETISQGAAVSSPSGSSGREQGLGLPFLFCIRAIATLGSPLLSPSPHTSSLARLKTLYGSWIMSLPFLVILELSSTCITPMCETNQFLAFCLFCMFRVQRE